MVDPNGLSQDSKPRVGLLVTCLADLIRPTLGFAAIQLLEASGCEVEAPLGETCCGQPALNAGAMKAAAFFARETIRRLEHYDYVVTPSGSCAATIKGHYMEVLAGDPKWLPRAQAVAAKTWELLSFLAHMRITGASGATDIEGRFARGAHGAREFHIDTSGSGGEERKP